MKASVYTSILYLKPLFNSHQTDANREMDFIGFTFTTIFFYFDDLKTKRLDSPSFFTDPQWDIRQINT
jgi:hypothetical protein